MDRNASKTPAENPPLVVGVFRSIADSVSSWVTKTPGGYAVTLLDDETGENLPMSHAYENPEEAMRYARTLV